MIQRFEEIIAWQKAQDLAVDLYKVLNGLNDWDFKKQIFRAIISVSNNIAEGFERNSRPQFNHFLDISLGSCGEVRSMLHLAIKLEYIDNNKALELIERASEISRITRGLKKKLFPLEKLQQLLYFFIPGLL